jgi:class 3 adenylate cyclase/tetratricopeptide (TPR) repeat protein
VLVRKTVTALFCDIDESVGLGERLDPEALRLLLARYFTEMSAVLERHGGTVEKYIGDAIVAIFGVPTVHEDDALRAVRAAAEMRDRLAELNDELERDYGVRVELQIGIDTGEVVVGGDSGGTLATGEAMNVAARLQQAAGPGEILIGKSTYGLVKDAVKAGPLETFPVKGKRKEVGRRRLDEVDVDAPGFARRLDAPLVGRRSELAELTDAFDHTVRDRSCHLFTLLGPAGIGKSRLAGELEETLGDRATWLTGRCLPYGEGITFWPLVQIVRAVGGDDAIAAALERSEHADVVREVLRGTIGPSPATGGSDETFWAVRRFLEALAASKPLVVCLEDIHWAEPTFLDLIEYLAGWVRDAPILLLCLARPDLLEIHPSWSTPKPNASLLRLEALSESEADALLDALRGDVALGLSARSRIATASEGNPLFVEQMVAMAVEEGGEDGQLAVPPSIHALLAERLDRLSADERAVAERASVIGKEFVRRHIADLCPAELRPTLGRHLMALVRKDLIRPDDSASAREDGFQFRHSLIRDAAYEGLPKEIRADLHERFAAQVEADVGGGRSQLEEIIGYHLEQAVRCRIALGRIGTETEQLALRAGARLAAAGRRALARGDVPAALKLLERGAALLVPFPARRSEVLLEVGALAREQGDSIRADALLREAEDGARAAGEERLELRSLLERCVLRLYLDPGFEAREVLEVVERATPVFERADDQLGLSRAWGLAAEAHWVRSQYATTEEALQRARSYAVRAGDHRELSWILGTMCRVALVGPRPVEDAVRGCLEIREQARADPILQPVIDSMLAVLEAMRGRFEEARACYRRSRSALEEFGLNVQLASQQMYAGWAELIAGDAATAERVLRTGYEALERMGERAYLATTAAFLARAALAQGRYAEAERLTEVSDDAASDDDLITHAMWRGTRARVLAEHGESGRAERLARESVERSLETDCVNMQADALVDLAETLRLLDRPSEAVGALEEALRLYELKGNVVSADSIRPLVGGALTG